MKSFNNKLKRILFLYPCYQFFFYERIYNFKALDLFFKDILKISDIEILIKFHPRHFNKSDYIFDLINENKIKYSVKNNLYEIIQNFDTVVGFEPSGALIDSLILSKEVIYINDYMNIYDNEKYLKVFLKHINSITFTEFLTITRTNDYIKSFKYIDIEYFKESDKSVNIQKIFTKIIDE